MPAAREHLTHLVDLAGRNTPDDRRRLAAELAELLLGWPDDYPLAMCALFEQLLEKAVRDADGERERRLGAYDSVPQEGGENLVRRWRAHSHAGGGEAEIEAA